MRKYKHSSGPWYTGHLCRDDHSCNCPYIFNEEYMGGIAEVYVNNGKKIGDGGNDAPPLEEAKANQRLISAAPKMYAFLVELEKMGIKDGLFDRTDLDQDTMFLDIMETLDFIDGDKNDSSTESN